MDKEPVLQLTTAVERISYMDIIRGISLLGIMLMNITGFGLYKVYLNCINYRKDLDISIDHI